MTMDAWKVVKLLEEDEAGNAACNHLGQAKVYDQFTRVETTYDTDLVTTGGKKLWKNPKKHVVHEWKCSKCV